LEGDLLAGEMFKLADEVALSALFADSGVVVVGSEVVIAGVGVGQQMPDD
jgi:ABC-type transporter Mla subunit MlaD